MATINGSTNNSNWTFKLEAVETANSVTNRNSTIKVDVYIGRASTQSYLGGSYNVSVSCAGQTQSSSGTIAYPTYINGGQWLFLKTFTFTVSNTGTNASPTNVSITSNFSSSAFTPSSASASGSLTLKVLHLDPTLNLATMVETNQDMIDLGVPDTTVVRHLSKKRITLNATSYDNATLSYQLSHFEANYAIPSETEYQDSNVFDTDYINNDVPISNNRAMIRQRVKDSLGGSASGFLRVLVDDVENFPTGIDYSKPSIVRTSTNIKRKSGGGVVLTDNKASLNIVATIYKNNDIIGNNNDIVEIGYKIWSSKESEPENYTPVTPNISDGNVTVTDLEILNIDYTQVYRYKIIITDTYGYSDTISDGKLSTGDSVWTEYKNRVDFKRITLGGFDIVESGISNDNGEYIKFANGKMICVCQYTTPSLTWSQDGSFYISQEIPLPDFPHPYIKPPTVIRSVQHLNITGRNVWISTAEAPTDTNPGYIRMATYWEATYTYPTVSYIAFGDWK